jgi:hypothetical protein
MMTFLRYNRFRRPRGCSAGEKTKQVNSTSVVLDESIEVPGECETVPRTIPLPHLVSLGLQRAID